MEEETEKCRRVVGRPFAKNDPRINKSGRPRGFDEMRRKAQEIACEMVTDSQGNKMTCVEALLRSWAKSKEPQLQKAFVEYCYGKVPEKLDVNELKPQTTLRLYFAHEFDRIQNDGQDPVIRELHPPPDERRLTLD